MRRCEKIKFAKICLQCGANAGVFWSISRQRAIKIESDCKNYFRVEFFAKNRSPYFVEIFNSLKSVYKYYI